ncbi:hypothetical protein KEM54_003100 [Ascosphaera aggregata]|nr:hypothetical protein KEM54_003100 [Ascosphaera aggregata]
MEHVTDLWGLRCATGSTPGLVDTLVVSFVNETRVFQFLVDGEVEEVDSFLGLSLEQSTLLAANLPHDRIVQVLENRAIICTFEKQNIPWTWAPPSGQAITAAAINDLYLVLIVDGRSLHAFDVTGIGFSNSFTLDFPGNEQISGVTLSSEFPSVCIICHPQTAGVRAADLKGKYPVSNISLGTPGDDVPRSVTIAQVLPEGPPTVLVAMADGSVFSLSFNVTDYTLIKLSRILLSSEPASFKKLPRADGTYNVFAACEQSSLIYASEGRIIYSAVDCEPGTRICHFNTETYPGSIAVATPSKLKIAVVDSERMTQVHTLSVGETVYRTAYSQAERAFVLGTIKRDLQDGAEVVTSHFVLADEILFRKLNVYDLNPDELVSSVISFSLIIGQDASGKDIVKDIFAIGTAYAGVVDSADVSGRIILFEITENRELDVLHELPLRGACRALAFMEDNKLVAALIKSVVVFDICTDRFGDVRLSKKAAYRTSTAPTDITVTGDIIAVSDLMKSLSLIQFKQIKAGEREALVEIARHYQTVWSTCVANIDENIWLEGDAEGNLILLGRNMNGFSPADQKRMVVLGEIHLGEMVNRVRPVRVQVGADAVVTPKAFMATVDGSIYLLGLVNPRYQDFLMRLQAGMGNLVTTPGKIPFNTFRGFRNQVRRSDEPYRFVDGELVERFLELPSQAQEDLVDSLNTTAELARTEKISVTRVRDIMEELRRLH